MLVISILCCGCSGKNNNEDRWYDFAIRQVMICYNGNVYEAIVNEDGKSLDEYINGKSTGRKLGTYNGKSIIDIPETDGIFDITKCIEITDGVYDASSKQGYQYINKLCKSGYKVIYEAKTYKFSEYYLENKNNELVRVIITDNYTVVSAVNSKLKFECDLTEYIFD